MNVATKPYLKKQIIVLIFANLVVLIPFVAWMTISPLLPPDHLMSVPRVLSFSLFFYSLVFGLVCCVIVSILVGFPALYRLKKRGIIDAGEYIAEITVCVGIWSVLAGILAGPVFGPVVAILAGGLVFVSLFIPSCLAGLTYWYFAVNNKYFYPILVALLVLFLLWNFVAANLAAFAAID